MEKGFLSSNDEYYVEAMDELSFLKNEQINNCEDCVDLILSFHSDEDWIDSENLHLLDERINQLKSEDDGCSGGARIPKRLLQMFSSIGIKICLYPIAWKSFNLYRSDGWHLCFKKYLNRGGGSILRKRVFVLKRQHAAFELNHQYITRVMTPYIQGAL